MCVSGDSGVFSVVCYSVAAPLLSFAEKFYEMTRNLKSAIFDSTWTTTMIQARESNANLSVHDVESKIWTPVINQCQKLLNELHECLMPLVEVDQHFKNYKEVELEQELAKLLSGIHKCIPQHSSCGDWIHDRVHRIVDYLKLCKYREAANYFLDIRNSLELTQGDFRDVERISQEVHKDFCVMFYNYITHTYSSLLPWRIKH